MCELEGLPKNGGPFFVNGIQRAEMLKSIVAFIGTLGYTVIIITRGGHNHETGNHSAQ